MNWGPSSEVDTGDESDSPQCPSSDISRLISSRQPKGCVTFIRGWRLKKRKLWSPKTIRAAAEPRDLDDNEDFDPESEPGQVFISTTPEVRESFCAVTFLFLLTWNSNPTLLSPFSITYSRWVDGE